MKTSKILTLVAASFIFGFLFANQERFVDIMEYGQEVIIRSGESVFFLYGENTPQEETSLVYETNASLNNGDYILVARQRPIEKKINKTSDDRAIILSEEGVLETKTGDNSSIGDIIFDSTILFEEFGQTEEIKFGQKLNIKYGPKIAEKSKYILYQLKDNGYMLTLQSTESPVRVSLDQMCKKIITPDPYYVYLDVAEHLRYEQIIWTPTNTGKWEVRIGTTNRGCKSPALDWLQTARTAEYEVKKDQ
ncbi:MAG: hypothetical protein Kapaf2KO_16540 [Candidatus Kapaibacteriales bacterium]